MAQYYVYTQIKSNVDSALLYYEMQAHRTGKDGTKLVVLNTGIQALQSDYKTQRHETIDTTESKSALFILEIMLYRKLDEQFIPLLSKQESSIYSLGQFSSDKVINANSKENIVYMETTQKTKEAKDGEINTYTLKISTKERVFIAPEHPISDPLDPFVITKMQKQLSDRLNYISFPDQNRTMLCGPAAFFYCLQKDRPDLYKQSIIELWEKGKTRIGDLEIKPSFKTRHPEGYFQGSLEKISGIDWISLASLRDSENNLINYSSPSDNVSAITMWGVLGSWFIKAGAQKKFSNISIFRSNIDDVVELNNHIREGNHIVSLISAGMLMLGAESPFKDHWIVWDSQLRLAKDNSLITSTTDLTEYISLKLFSWGRVENSLKENLTLQEFLDHTFGGMVFTKIP